MDTMQAQFERQYLDALADGDENAIELTTYNLQWLTPKILHLGIGCRRG